MCPNFLEWQGGGLADDHTPETGKAGTLQSWGGQGDRMEERRLEEALAAVFLEKRSQDISAWALQHPLPTFSLIKASNRIVNAAF